MFCLVFDGSHFRGSVEKLDKIVRKYRVSKKTDAFHIHICRELKPGAH